MRPHESREARERPTDRRHGMPKIKTARTSRIVTLSEKMLPQRLPKLVFFVKRTAVPSVIIPLTGLRAKTGQGHTCDFLQIIGEDVIAHGKVRHVNVVEAPANRCFTDLKTALAYVADQQVRSERSERTSELTRHTSHLKKMRHLNDFRQEAYDVLRDMDVLREGVTGPGGLSREDLRQVANEREAWDAVIERVLAREFPGLTEVEADDE